MLGVHQCTQDQYKLLILYLQHMYTTSIIKSDTEILQLSKVFLFLLVKLDSSIR